MSGIGGPWLEPARDRADALDVRRRAPHGGSGGIPMHHRLFVPAALACVLFACDLAAAGAVFNYRDTPVDVDPAVEDSWEGVDRGLFDTLRQLRAKLARARGVPAYVVFGDAALRDMARRRPSTTERFLEVKGVGEAKCQQYGKVMVGRIRQYCQEHGEYRSAWEYLS